MITSLTVSSALAKPLESYNVARRSSGCHLTIRNFSTHPLKAGLRLTSPNGLVLNCETKDASTEADRVVMPGSHMELVVQQNGWRTTNSKFKIFLSYHVMESATEMSRKVSTCFVHFLLPVSIVYDRRVSCFCGFANAFPDFDLQNDKREDAEAVFEYWKDQLLQLSRYALQVRLFLGLCIVLSRRVASILVD